MTTETLTPVFAALGDDTRWAILARLGEAPASASALAREFPISRQAIVKHLELLDAAGLVETERVGRELVHRALGGRLSDVARELERIGRRWDSRLARIKRLAEETELRSGTDARLAEGLQQPELVAEPVGNRCAVGVQCVLVGTQRLGEAGLGDAEIEADDRRTAPLAEQCSTGQHHLGEQVTQRADCLHSAPFSAHGQAPVG